MLKTDFRKHTIFYTLKKYMRILSKVTKKKYVTISHPSFSKELRTQLILVIKQKLKMNDAQASYLLDAHTIKDINQIKPHLLSLDEHPKDMKYFAMGEFYYRVIEHSKYQILNSLSVVLTVIFIISAFVFISAGVDGKLTLIFIGLYMSFFILLNLSIQIYYRQILRLKLDLRYPSEDRVEGQIIKIKFYEILRIRSRGLNSFHMYGLKLVLENESGKFKVIYPFLDHDISIFGNKDQNAFRIKNQTLNELQKKETLEVSYLSYSKMITYSSIDFNQIIDKMNQ